MSDTPTWQQLLDLLTQWSDSDFESASLEIGDVSFRVSRSGPVTAPPVPAAAHAPAPAPAPAADPVSSLDPAPAQQGAGTPVTAPMIGVFYRSPAPGKPTFVEPGSTVRADTTVGIIEVMKLMSPVVAGVRGTLIAFEVEDGQQIEYGQLLARIEPS